MSWHGTPDEDRAGLWRPKRGASRRSSAKVNRISSISIPLKQGSPAGWRCEAACRLSSSLTHGRSKRVTASPELPPLCRERCGARWCAAIVCVGKAEKDQGIRAGISASWHVIPNGVDLRAFTPADDVERRSARHRLNLDDVPLVVIVGRLCRQKGQDILLDAWPQVRGRVPRAQLAIVGDGPDRAQLERQAVAGVRYVGRRTDVHEWLAAADVVVLPSRWEGMALSMLEALARARCVVASDVSGVRDVLDVSPGPSCQSKILMRWPSRSLRDSSTPCEPQPRASPGGGASRAITTLDIQRQQPSTCTRNCCSSK